MDGEVIFVVPWYCFLVMVQCPLGEEVGMCKVVPMKVEEVFPGEERVTVLGPNGNSVPASTVLFTGTLEKGDFVVLQAGYVVERLATKEALEILQILREAAKFDAIFLCPYAGV